MKRILFLVSFILIVHCTLGQAPALKTTVDKKEILIGQPLKYKVAATFPANTFRMIWFNVEDSFNHFEVVTRGKVDTTESNGMLTCTQTLTLTSFDSGINVIPALTINFDPLINGTAINIFTDSIPVSVSFSPMDSSKTFHDIKTIIEVKNEIPLWV